MSEALIWQLESQSRRAVETFLGNTGAAISDGVCVWLGGGQESPAADMAPERYAGRGAAQLCLDRAQAAGVRVRRLDPLDLLGQWLEGAERFREPELIFLDRPETALPTPGLRQAIESLLSEAWEWRGSLVIATELALSPAPSALPAWHGFLERAAPTLGHEGWSSLRSSLHTDPALPMLGEVHPLMLREPCSDDYLTARARGLLARLDHTAGKSFLSAVA